MTQDKDIEIEYRGCFDPECCNGEIWGFEFDCRPCPGCGEYTELDSNIDASDLSPGYLSPDHTGKTLVLTCECGVIIQSVIPDRSPLMSDMKWTWVNRPAEDPKSALDDLS